MSSYKVLSPEQMVNRSAGDTIDMFCADNVLRKRSATNLIYQVTCKPYIEVDDQNRQILHYYWDLADLRTICGLGELMQAFRIVSNIHMLK